MQVRDELQSVDVEEKMSVVHKSRLTNVWSSELNAKNKVKATNTDAASVFPYSLPIID